MKLSTILSYNNFIEIIFHFIKWKTRWRGSWYSYCWKFTLRILYEIFVEFWVVQP